MELNGLAVRLQEECHPQTCTQMTATEQWIFLCAAHKTPKECPAIDYTRHTLDGAACLLNSNKYFPSRSVSICRQWHKIVFVIKTVLKYVNFSEWVSKSRRLQNWAPCVDESTESSHTRFFTIARYFVLSKVKHSYVADSLVSLKSTNWCWAWISSFRCRNRDSSRKLKIQRHETRPCQMWLRRPISNILHCRILTFDRATRKDNNAIMKLRLTLNQ